MPAQAAGFSFLEHTADVGIHAWGPSLAAAFEQAGTALVRLMGADATTPGRAEALHVEATDLGSLLVAFLDRLIFRSEVAGDGVSAIDVTRITTTSLDASLSVAPLASADEGLVVKAATFHALEVTELADGSADLRVYLDV